MEVFEAYKGMYDCIHLPAFARYLLNNHVESFAKEQISLSRKYSLPLMVSLSSRLTEIQLLDFSKESSREYLEYLAANTAMNQVKDSMEKWLHDQLEIVGKGEITAEDITLVNHIRGQALKSFIPLYTSDVKEAFEINRELDILLLGTITTATNIYIGLLKDKIAEQSNLSTKLIAASPAITFLYDSVNSKHIFVSGKISEVLGYTPEEIVQMGNNVLIQMTHPDDLEQLAEHLRNIISENTNETKQFEYRFKHKDGNYRWLRTYEVIFKRDSKGKPIEILAKTFEITNEKETAIALEKRERQLLEAQSIAHIGSYEWDMRENWSSNSDEVFRIFELDKAQKHEEFMTYVHPDDVQKVKDAIAQSYVSGFYDSEYRYLKNGKEKVIWSLGKVEFKDNMPYRMVGTVQDITEIKRMEKELIQKTSELANSNESLRQFAYVVSHDMKEPLRKIMMYSDLVISAEREKISDKSLSQLKKMESASRNLYRMIEDILSFSMLEAKEVKQKISLESIINQVTETLDENIKEKNARIIYNGLPEAYIISSQFRQLFQNLISNSLKFSKKEEAPKIEIGAKITLAPSLKLPANSKQYLEISIKDNGIGFPDEHSDKIFELFNRIHTKSEYEGTGLGLSITRRIVENHEGAISASSQEGAGSTFTIVIPQPNPN